jgi:hypothetical protein
MKKNLLYILPAIALFASCGGGATIDNAALDAKVAAQVKSTTDQLKTNCDALVATTSQMRADSIMAVKNAKANMPVAVPAPKTSPAAAPAKPTAKVPVKAPVKTTVKVVKKVEVVKTAKDIQREKFANENGKAKATKEQIKTQKDKFNNDNGEKIKATKEQIKVQQKEFNDR